MKQLLTLCLALSMAQPMLAASQQFIPPTAKVPPPSTAAAPGVYFTEVTKAAGLAQFRFISGTAAKDYIIEAPGSGCAFLDFDNDGWLDIYLVNGSTLEALRGKAAAPRAALYRNNRNGTFTDVTEKAGVANERWGQGVCIGDYNNDGWEDIYVTNFGRNRLYRNNRDGTFTDVAEKAGVALGGWSSGCAFGDYNGDGLLDLFVAGYVKFDINNPPPPASGGHSPGRREGKSAERPPDRGEWESGRRADAGTETSDVNPQSRKAQQVGTGASYAPGLEYCSYRGQRVMCGPRGLEGEPDHLFRNNGDGTFTDMSEKAGVADKKRYYGFAVAWFDADDDGRLDLFVANDSTPNYLYHNKGDGTFEDISFQSGAALNETGREQACMGVAIGDVDGDGRDDIHVTNFSDDLNTLYHNDDGLQFTETTYPAGLGEITFPFLGWGTNFFDYDHDGALDLLVANGHIYPNIDEASWGTSYKQRLLLFRNLKGRFHEVGSSAGETLYSLRCSRGSSVGDFDNDGDLDILLSNMDDSPTLLRNDGANKAGHWLVIKLIGNPAQKCPRDAIGSVVFCTANGQRQRAEVASGRSFYSQSDLRLHFGLGAAVRVEKLEVRWANGKTEQFQIEGVDRFVTIEQGRGIVASSAVLNRPTSNHPTSVRPTSDVGRLDVGRSDGLNVEHRTGLDIGRFEPRTSNVGRRTSSLQQSDEITSSFNRAVEMQRQGKWEEAAAEYRALLRRWPGYAEAQANLGAVLARLGDYQGAIAAYEAALRLNPQLTPALLNLGITHYRAGQFARAVLALERFLAVAPDHLQARQLIGLSLVELGRDKEAIARLEPTLSAEADVTVLYSLGLAYLRQNRPEVGAIIERLAAHADGAALAHLLRGRAHLEMFEFNQATSELEAAARYSLDLPQLEFLLALAYLKLGRSEEAKTFLERQLNRTPDDFSALYYLAYLLEKQGELQQARQYIEAALKQEPQSVEAGIVLGSILLKQGQAAEAARVLEQRRARHTDNAELLYLLARSYQKLGRKQEAARMFAEVERLNEKARESEKQRKPDS